MTKKINVEYLRTLVQEKIIPDLGRDFIDSEASFVLYLLHDNGEEWQVTKTVITPPPPFEIAETVFKATADELSKNIEGLPSIVIALEKMRYSQIDMSEIEEDKEKTISVDTLDRGMIIIALEAVSAKGIAMLYSLPDLEEMTSKEVDARDDTGKSIPPYCSLAIATVMHELLVKSDLVEEDKESDDNKIERNRPKQLGSVERGNKQTFGCSLSTRKDGNDSTELDFKFSRN